MDFFAALRRHHDDPSCQHLKPLLNSIIGTLENMQNDFQRQMETYMSDIVNQLTAAVGTLSANVVAHDATIQKAIADLQASLSPGIAPEDQAAITAAIAAISGASSTVAAETAAVVATMPVPVQAAAAAAAPSPAVAAAAPAGPAAPAAPTATGG